MAGPFSTALWLAVLLTLLLLSAILWLCGFERDPCTALLFILSTFCQRAQPWPPVPRVLVLATLPSAVTLLAAYSGALVSSLAAQDLAPPFETLQGLLQDGSYHLEMVGNTAHVEDFQCSKNKILYLLYTTQLQHHLAELPTTPQEGISKLCTRDKYVFMMPVENSIFAASVAPCSLVELRRASLTDNLALALAKGNPYRDIINYSIQKLRHSGTLAKIRRDSYPKTFTHMEVELHSVSFGETAAFLIILASGGALGVVLLCLEQILAQH